SVPMNRRGIASGISSTLLNTGSLLSLGVSFAIMAQSMPLNVLQAIFAGIPIQAGQVNAVLFQQAMQKIFIFMASISFIAAVPSWLRGPAKTPEETKIT